MSTEIMDKKKNRKTIAIWVGLAIVGLVCVVTLIVLEGHKEKPDYPMLWQNIVSGVSCSVVASAIFSFFQRAYTQDINEGLRQQLENIEKNIKQSNELYNKGIISIHPKSHFDNEEIYWKRILQNTSFRLDLIGHSISHWFRVEYKNSFLAKIKDVLDSGNDVNIILSTELSSTDISSADAEQQVLQHVKKAYIDSRYITKLNKIERTLLHLCRFIDDIPEDKQHHLKVYVTDLRQVTYLYIRTDNQCIISPYTHSLDYEKNSFLLEFKPGSFYIKPLEDDFEDMIGKMHPVNLLIHKNVNTNNEFQFLETKETKNKYSGSDWDTEKTKKYIFKDSYGKYEVGYFEHFAGNERKKTVIELPVSYGCPSHCLYCASSNTESFHKLKSDQLKKLFDYVYDCEELADEKYVLLSLTGMGDVFFSRDEVFDFLSKLSGYSNLNVTISSNFWSSKLLKDTIAALEKLPIRFIQQTYIGNNSDVIKQLIPFSSSLEHDFGIDPFVQYVSQQQQRIFRINYIGLSGINDSDEDIATFISKIEPVKDKVTVRISRLNETNATKRNNLKATSIERLQEIKERISDAGVSCYVFFSERNDHMNCGQLVTETEI